MRTSTSPTRPSSHRSGRPGFPGRSPSRMATKAMLPAAARRASRPQRPGKPASHLQRPSMHTVPKGDCKQTWHLAGLQGMSAPQGWPRPWYSLHAPAKALQY